jgi:hypothetical protein
MSSGDASIATAHPPANRPPWQRAGEPEDYEDEDDEDEEEEEDDDQENGWGEDEEEEGWRVNPRPRGAATPD